jgi:hypothetical protein
VNWFRRADPSAVVILVNDHNSRNARLPAGPRPLNNVFIGTDIFKGANMSRKIMSVDFFPTIVEAAGGIIKGCRLGIGTSVSARCRHVLTLREKYGDDKIDALMGSKNMLYRYLMTGK